MYNPSISSPKRTQDSLLQSQALNPSLHADLSRTAWRRRRDVGGGDGGISNSLENLNFQFQRLKQLIILLYFLKKGAKHRMPFPWIQQCSSKAHQLREAPQKAFMDAIFIIHYLIFADRVTVDTCGREAPDWLLIGWVDGRMGKERERQLWKGRGLSGTKTRSAGQRPLVAIHQLETK